VHKPELTFEKLIAFVQGVDHGSEFVALDGFREYLVLKLGDDDHLAWTSLVLKLSLPAGFTFPLSADLDQLAVQSTFDLLDEFLTQVGRHSNRGRAAIRREHQLWRQEQSWYEVDAERFASWPAGELVDVSAAARILGIDPEELLERVYRGEVAASWRGAQLLFRKERIESLAGGR
jgi:hypothetical protein